MKQQLNIAYEHYDSIEQMSEADCNLIMAARKATAQSDAPYSKFNGGAAARLKSGRIITGANRESEVYPSGLCAERVLLYNLQINHADAPIVAFAIASEPAERECYPCGSCRQTLLDAQKRQQSPIRIIMSSQESATVVDSAEELLPFSFKL